MKLVLASKSRARIDMLRAAGLEFETFPADLDEGKVLQGKGLTPEDSALFLAQQKALVVSSKKQGDLIVGADQVLECGGRILFKAEGEDDAQEKLKFLRSKTHRLISAVCAVQDGKILWSATKNAHLSMRHFDDEFLKRYCEKAGPALTRSVGAYELESFGVQLFERVEGDYFTILGLPLLPLLAYLRDRHGIGL